MQAGGTSSLVLVLVDKFDARVGLAVVFVVVVVDKRSSVLTSARRGKDGLSNPSSHSFYERKGFDWRKKSEQLLEKTTRRSLTARPWMQCCTTDCNCDSDNPSPP